MQASELEGKGAKTKTLDRPEPDKDEYTRVSPNIKEPQGVIANTRSVGRKRRFEQIAKIKIRLRITDVVLGSRSGRV